MLAVSAANDRHYWQILCAAASNKHNRARSKMGCGPALMNGRSGGAGSKLMPYYFGPRPSPVRPVPPFGDLRQQLHALQFPNQRRVLLRRNQRALNGFVSTSGPPRLVAPAEDWRVAQGNDCCAQAWREGNLLAGRVYELPVRPSCNCARMRR